MSIFNNIRKKLRGELTPLNEFRCDLADASTTTKAIRGKWTLLLSGTHFKERYNLRVKPLKDLLGINLAPETIIQDSVKDWGNLYKDLLKASNCDFKSYPRIQNKSYFVTRYDYTLFIEDNYVGTLQIGNIVTCEKVSNRTAVGTFQEQHKILKNITKVPDLLNAIEKGQLVKNSPVFLMATVAINLTENPQEEGIKLDSRDKFVTSIKKSVSDLHITQEQLDKLKAHIKATLH